MARSLEELECWRLADLLRREVIAICAQGIVARHFKFCDGFIDAAGTVCRNLIEGYARGDSGQIVQFFGYALGSLGEVQDYLRDSLHRQFIDRERFVRLNDLAEHVRATTLRFREHHRRRREERSRRPRRSFDYRLPDEPGKPDST